MPKLVMAMCILKKNANYKVPKVLRSCQNGALSKNEFFFHLGECKGQQLPEAAARARQMPLVDINSTADGEKCANDRFC